MLSQGVRSHQHHKCLQTLNWSVCLFKCESCLCTVWFYVPVTAAKIIQKIKVHGTVNNMRPLPKENYKKTAETNKKHGEQRTPKALKATPSSSLDHTVRRSFN